MNNLKFLLPVFTFFVMTGTTIAQENLTEKGISAEKTDLRASYTSIEKDKAELKDFNHQITRLEAAFEDNDLESIQVIQKNLIDAIQREIKQNEAKTEGYSIQKQKKILDEIEDYDFSNHATSKAHAQENLNLLKMFSMGMEADIAVSEKQLDSQRKALRSERKKKIN